MAVNQIINNISVLAIFLTGAAVLREREHGNIEHLLVMPLQPVRTDVRQDLGERAGRRGRGAGLAVLGRQGAVGVPIAGSIPLFAGGLGIYLFSVTALGIMLATVVRSMPQFGLLAFPVFIVMNLLSGGQTPLESMPIVLQKIMQFVPSTHFVSFSQAVLFRNADISHGMAGHGARCSSIGSAYTVFTLSRFRKMLAAVQ